MMTLTKKGNLKIGVVRDGKPIQTSTILVTTPTKDGQENFRIMDGFNPDGEKSVSVILPFDKPELNFEVGYVGFANIEEQEYILKATDIGEPLYMIPLYTIDETIKVIRISKNLTHKDIAMYKLEKSGFLQVMVKDISGYGEVFYFKTKSINTIANIQNQLKMYSTLTKGHLAGLELEMSPVRKEIGENEVMYISLAYKGDIFVGLEEYRKNRANAVLDISAFEELYSEKFVFNDFIDMKELDPTVNINFNISAEEELVEMEKEVVKEDNFENLKFLMKEKLKEENFEIFEMVPIQLSNQVFLTFDKNIEKFEKFLESKPSVKDFIKTLTDTK
jgi:hypothetical protein